MSILRATGRFLKHIEQVVWHNYCRCCGGLISHDDEHFCGECAGKLGMCFVDSYCRRCGREMGEFEQWQTNCPKCEDEEYYFDAISCAGVYKEPLNNLILQFKLADRTSLLPVLSDFTQKALSRSPFISEIDYFVPVPMHWTKEFKRGFNQAHLIARKIKFPDTKINNDLVRIRNTKSQTEMTISERRKNLLNAFAVRKNHKFSGKKICLIDDVKTTGATLNECAKVLKEAGAVKVFAFVLAVAGQGK